MLLPLDNPRFRFNQLSTPNPRVSPPLPLSRAALDCRATVAADPDDYEEDFEAYDDDFEEDEEETKASAKPTPSASLPKLPANNNRSPLSVSFALTQLGLMMK